MKKLKGERFLQVTRKYGRPLKYNDPKEMEERVLEYVEEMSNKKKPITLSGVALRLGMTVSNLKMMAEENTQYSDIVQWILTVYEHSLEERMFSKDGNTSAEQFGLKQLGWSDKQKIENSGSQTLNIQVASFSDKNVL